MPKRASDKLALFTAINRLDERVLSDVDKCRRIWNAGNNNNLKRIRYSSSYCLLSDNGKSKLQFNFKLFSDEFKLKLD